VSLEVSFLNVKLNDVAIDPLFELIVAVNVVQVIDFRGQIYRRVTEDLQVGIFCVGGHHQFWTPLRMISITLVIQYLFLKGARMR
jgi:hypothetical protein